MIRGLLLAAGLAAVVVGAAVVADGLGGDADEPTSSLSPLLEVAQESVGELGADEPAPDFSVRTFDGGDFTLSHHLADDGRPVILNLWASWCFPCREEMPLFDAFAADHPEVLVVGVAVRDDPVAAERFATEVGVDYVLGLDDKDEVETAYRALGLPATFWIGSDGTMVKREFGPVTLESLEADLALFD